MADNITLNSGSGGATMAADDIGGVMYPRSKITIGADGSNDGDVSSANPLPCTSVITGNALTALQLIDNIVLAEDAAHVSGDPGVQGLTVRQDTAAALGQTDGDYQPLVTDSTGRLWCNVSNTVTVASHAVTNAGTFAVQVDGNALTALQLIDNVVHVDDAAFTLGTSSGVMMMGFAGTQSVNADDACALACTTAGALHVADAGGSLTVDNGGTFAVQVDGAALTALQLIDNPVLVDDAAFTPATSSVMMAGFQADESSTDSVNEGDAGAARITLDRKVIVTPQPHTTGGLSIFRSLDLDESEEEVKATAGQVYGGFITNTHTATLYVKFYNDTAANVSVGTTAPVITLAIPGNASDDIGATFNAGGHGIAFDTAITVACTTGLADNDTGAPGANALVINLWYK